jgi:uncharacterized protein YggE
MFRGSRHWFYLACAALLFVAMGATLAAQRVAAQGVPGQTPGIVVTGVGTASAPAESATVQVIVGPEMYGGPVAATLTDADLAPITDAVVGAGVDEAAIEIYIPATNSMFSGPGGPGNALLEFTLLNPTDASMRALSDALYQAATTARLSVQHLGVRYSATDCATLQQVATDAAVADARARAERLAKSLNAQLGTLTQAMDAIYGTGLPDSCAPQGFGGYGPYGPNITNPYDPSVAVEATATAQVMLTFEMEPSAGATPVSD